TAQTAGHTRDAPPLPPPTRRPCSADAHPADHRSLRRRQMSLERPRGPIFRRRLVSHAFGRSSVVAAVA
uniref:Uncharacterized protein n=1 Tax=Plectus sambesii TaxID=2011161 RepID=A0A914VH64_9BILA